MLDNCWLSVVMLCVEHRDGWNLEYKTGEFLFHKSHDCLHLMNAPFLRPDVAVEREDWAKSTRQCANTRKRKPNEARGRSVAWTAVTCCQEPSGLTIWGARPGKLVHHHRNLKYVHPICECYTFILFNLHFIAIEYARCASGCTDLKSDSMSSSSWDVSG